jgi:hypothetical protein
VDIVFPVGPVMRALILLFAWALVLFLPELEPL